ncbi:Integrase, catalytic region, partial [sediment metagenome]
KGNAVLLEKIQEIHKESDGTYGAPRMYEELLEQKEQASLNRVARVMKQAGLQGVSRRKGVRTTWRSKDAQPAEDLVNRDFTATGPDQLWVADMAESIGRRNTSWRCGDAEEETATVGSGVA